jgi:hypothetical protein
MGITYNYAKLLLVYGDKLKKIYPTLNTKYFLEASGIKYAVVDVEQQSIIFLNSGGEIIDRIEANLAVGNPGMRFKLEYYAKHILRY